MEKKTPKSKQGAISLELKTETLHRLDDSHLQRAAGVARVWIPIGFAADTTPIYSEAAG